MTTRLYFFALVALLVAAGTRLGAQTQTLRGTVLDRQSEAPLPGATVVVTDLQPAAGTTTDANGTFELTGIPVGRHSLTVRFVGYEPGTLTNVLVTAGKEVLLDVRLDESLVTLNELVVTAEVEKDKPVNEMATVSARQFNTEEVLRFSGGRNDVARLVTNFAGVATSNDSRNDIIIRGNAPTGVLWRLEGIPIPNPNHFSTLGTTGGPVSALNPNMIGASDFLTGAFPAEYGNALAGVFDVNLRRGNRERHERMFQLGAFSGLEGLLEGPFRKSAGGSYVVAYRHSFVEAANAAGLAVGTAALPRYRDLTFNVDFGQTRWGRFSVFGIAGASSIDFLAAEIDSTDLFADPDRNSYNTSRFGVAGLRHQLMLNNASYVRTVVSASHAGTTFDSESLTLGAEGEPLPMTNVDDRLNTWRASSFYNTKINARLTLRTGMLLQLQQLNTTVMTREGIADFDGDGLADYINVRDFDGAFLLSEAYAQSQYRLSNRLTLNAGVRALHFSTTNQLAAEPRAALNYKVSPRGSLNVGYGMHHQTQPLPVFLFRERQPDGSTAATNDNLGFTRSQHFVLGYDYKPATDWRIKTEIYYQAIDRVPVDDTSSSFSMLNAGADFVFPERGSLVNRGTGRNVGIELTAEKFFSRGFYGLFTVSLFESTYQGSDGQRRSTAFNGRHVVNLLAGKEFKLGSTGRRVLTLDTKVAHAGGRPYTPIDLAASSVAGREILFEDSAFSLRLDDYFRWDVKFGFRLNSPTRKLSQTFFLDFQNVTNRQNIFVQRYNPVRNTVGRVNQIGFFPDILYRLEF
jgi:hypothetical protein